MLSRLARDHAIVTQAKSARDADIKQREAKRSITQVTDHIYTSLTLHASKIEKDQADIESRTRELMKQTVQLQKSIDDWRKGITRISTACKELGHVNNWVQVIENDLKSIVNTLEFVYTGEDVGTSQQTGKSADPN